MFDSLQCFLESEQHLFTVDVVDSLALVHGVQYTSARLVQSNQQGAISTEGVSVQLLSLRQITGIPCAAASLLAQRIVKRPDLAVGTIAILLTVAAEVIHILAIVAVVVVAKVA